MSGIPGRRRIPACGTAPDSSQPTSGQLFGVPVAQGNHETGQPVHARGRLPACLALAPVMDWARVIYLIFVRNLIVMHCLHSMGDLVPGSPGHLASHNV